MKTGHCKPMHREAVFSRAETGDQIPLRAREA